MNEDQSNPNNLLDTTDCLEAISVFRSWKNLLFAVILVCLLLLQGIFWLVNTECIKVKTTETVSPIAQAIEETAAKNEIPAAIQTEAKTVVIEDKTAQIEKAAKKVVTEPNTPIPAVTPKVNKSLNILDKITYGQVSILIRMLNFILIPAAILHCLAMLFILKISLMGRLGGINHISRAFFLSLLFIVVLLPWQTLFPQIAVGVMYTGSELKQAVVAAQTSEIFSESLFYIRFSLYWFIALLFIFVSQIRSARWSKTILRRLEIV